MTPAIEAWLPKSIILLRDYDRHKFLADLIAGVTVGLVALPLAMAFAIASGLSPQAGLYCAIVTGFLISALGGSTMMAGVLLVLLGVTGMGTMVKYFPRPVDVRILRRFESASKASFNLVCEKLTSFQRRSL